MTDVKPNLLGRYSKQEVDQIIEENRILEMRWQVFEDLYDKTRQELEKWSYTREENFQLRKTIERLEQESAETEKAINSLQQIINTRSIEIAKLNEVIDSFLGSNGHGEPLKSIEDGLLEITTAVPNPNYIAPMAGEMQ
jgi:uncharacterized protein (DUF3084 family)